MTETIKFEKLIEEQCYNKLSSALKPYIIKYKDSFYSPRIHGNPYVELDDISVKGTSYEKSDSGLLNIWVTVNATITLSGKGDRDYESDSVYKTYTVVLQGSLESSLSSFKVISTGEYSKRGFNKNTSLSKWLVPYLYSKDLDKEAEKFLEKYYPQALDRPMAVNVDEIVKKLGLQMYYSDMGNSVFGRSYFGEADAEIIDVFTESKETVHLNAGTILINPNVFYMRNVGSVRNTIIHECVHWDRHRDFFRLQKLLDKEISHLNCEVVETYDKNVKGIDSALAWIEWQANALAPHILMPAETSRIKFEEIVDTISRLYPVSRKAYIYEEAVRKFAEFYTVSIISAKLRLMDLGYDFLVGTYVYINGNKQEPFTFKQGQLNMHQTYFIDIRNSAFLSAVNPVFKELNDSGSIAYVNGLFCLNDEKYVIQKEGEKTRLTDYALDHVDECCFIFDRTTKVSKDYDDSYYRMCFLCRDIDSKDLIEADFNPDYKDNQDKVERAREIVRTKEAFKETSEIIKETAGLSFGECLKFHMKRRGITQEDLEERSNISVRSISDYCRNVGNIQLKTVLALCIGMNLKTEYCYSLLEKARIVLQFTEEDLAIKELINHHTDENIDEWNKKLEEFGVKLRLPTKKL